MADYMESSVIDACFMTSTNDQLDNDIRSAIIARCTTAKSERFKSRVQRSAVFM